MGYKDETISALAAFISVPEGGFVQNGNILPGVMTVKEYLSLKCSGKLGEVLKQQRAEDAVKKKDK